MSKKKVLAKLANDNAQFTDGHDSMGSYFFEAWLPGNLIWDCNHRVGSVYVSRDQVSSMSDFWKNVWAEIEGPTVEQAG